MILLKINEDNSKIADKFSIAPTSLYTKMLNSLFSVQWFTFKLAVEYRQLHALYHGFCSFFAPYASFVLMKS